MFEQTELCVLSVTKNYFLKYEDLLLSLSFLARAPDCKPSEASARRLPNREKEILFVNLEIVEISIIATYCYIPSSITSPKLAVNTPTPPRMPIANKIGTYTGGNSATS